MGLSANHPFVIAMFIIAVIAIFVIATCLLVGIIKCSSMYWVKWEATREAKAVEKDTKKAREAAIKKVANNRLAEFNRRRELITTRADGWQEAQIAMEMDQLQLEDEAAAGRKALQAIEVILVQEEVSKGMIY